MKAKTKEDVYGYRENCINFKQCPLCYGCRNYNSASIKCIINCKPDFKMNICRKDKHRSDILANFIKPQHYQLLT